MQESLKKLRRKRIAKVLFGLVLVGAFLRLYILIPTDVTGISMYPTFDSNDKVVMSTVSSIERFDILVFTDPMNKTVVKRVIGLPGESIRYEQDQLYVNNQIVAEPFFDRNEINEEPGLWTSNFDIIQTGDQRVPEGEYFLMGDNRRYSYDSRFYGSISSESVIGKVVLLYYPFERIGWH
ncbi:signal peptidase I [Marinilactibacillus sp. XAAS-LB27]|uniref:signal peptidase I n=1 Tax=Marinilactibacillus sp. XAAS-LB27 TaxID=3114538 RepID=UPI002E1963C8|nr:signal peptidase I [Marinilactibacillus sp. XAAS-LB27]